MVAFEHALILLLLIASLSVVGRWLPWPQLITYLLGGVGAALVPAFPKLTLDPGFFFLCFLPPLLFADGWLMPLREFVRARRAILTLAIGLVLFTTVAVGLVAWWLVPGLPLAMAFALGAIVSPTDAVAVNAITERLRVPARLTTVLNGESLMNDATGLVAFKFALAAVVAGGFSLSRIAIEFSLLSVGGFLTGLAIGYGLGRLRDVLQSWHADDPHIAITLNLMTPFAAYLTAERLGVSGILAVVAAGLYSGWRDPVRTDVETRQSTFAVWRLLLFWLNGIAFVLLGLQFPTLLAAVRDHYSAGQLLGFTAAVSGAAIVARLAWVFSGIYLPALLPGVCTREMRPASGLALGWAGMRGTVTLAGALSIPLLLPDGSPFPGRDIVIFLAFGVIAATLLVQGTTLERLIQRLGLREDDTRAQEERLARTTAVDAGLQALRALEFEATAPDHAAALGQVIGEYEHRLAVLEAEGETRRSARRRRQAGHRYRTAALQAERHAVDELWRTGKIADEVHRPLQQLLDHEEAVLRGAPPPAEE
ncbi:Na+/H+ antiporter [Opitutus sp. GAS368]|jgi:Na+/H+ antiporter|uniref:Na+/H+ antiporter n=1 Tax=Opitutus sp. GAS368 TaxID=1882749 RepID=UPI00087A09FC|nr:Na+/H+ antiporter [Opitutus sp. GAS368]SDS29993.1 sodium/proton antiporter, CPA1 family [Opitutus sp. GAS368]